MGKEMLELEDNCMNSILNLKIMLRFSIINTLLQNPRKCIQEENELGRKILPNILENINLEMKITILIEKNKNFVIKFTIAFKI